MTETTKVVLMWINTLDRQPANFVVYYHSYYSYDRLLRRLHVIP